MTTFNKILIVNLGGIGDIMLSTPAVRAIRQAYPAAQLCILCARPPAEYCRSLTYVDKVFTLDLKSGIGFLHNLNSLRTIRLMHFDIAINMRTIVSAQGRSRIKFLFDGINPAQKAGRNTSGRGDFFDITVPEEDGFEQYEMEYDLAMAQLLTGIPVQDRHIDFVIDERSALRAGQRLAAVGINDTDTVIGFHIGGRPSRIWPAEYFRETIAVLAQKTSCKCIATGDTSDLRYVRKAMQGVPLLNLAGELSLFELGAVIRRCNVFVSPDTAPMHIAAVLGTPLVAILGPGCIRRFDPRVISQRAIVLYKKADCAPCERVTCASLKCLKTIQPAEVVQAVRELL